MQQYILFIAETHITVRNCWVTMEMQ